MFEVVRTFFLSVFPIRAAKPLGSEPEAGLGLAVGLGVALGLGLGLGTLAI